jgi:hypothetical protein
MNGAAEAERMVPAPLLNVLAIVDEADADTVDEFM